MLISALCSYYDMLAANNRVLPDGYSEVKIHFLVGLTPEGKIAEIVDWQQRTTVQRGKGKAKEITSPRMVRMPLRTEKTCVDANIAEHRPLYIFGLNLTEQGLTAEDKTNKAQKSHEAFVKKQVEFLEGLQSDLIDAYRNFVLSWNPQEETTNPHLQNLGKLYSNAGFAFCMAGRPDRLLHEDTVLNQAWQQLLATEQNQAADTYLGQCAILGETLPIARIHNKIKNVPKGLATGNVLVAFKNQSEESYGKNQSYNSNVSQAAANRYTEALNYLMSNRAHRVVLGDITILHWAMSADPVYDQIVQAGIFSGFEDEDGKLDKAETEKMLETMMQDARDGTLHKGQLGGMDGIDPNVTFYIAGFKPNSARLAVKFVYRQRFGELFCNIAQHQLDMQMSEAAKPVSLWRIQKELLVPKISNDSLDPALSDKLIESILYGYRYPEELLYLVVRRIKTDSDEEKNTYIKLNSVRVGIVKACLNRRARLAGKKEEFTMALDKNNTNSAYLCGRLFAVLEQLQQDASGNSLNRTIKDAYFSSACTQPAIIFPKLLRLAQNHLAKANYGSYWNSMIGEISAKLDGAFPTTLPLEEQGKFILGYYHQFFNRLEKKTEAISNNEEE